MHRTRVLLFASVVTAALILGGVVGATAARTSLSAAGSPLSVLAASSPSPAFHSNENATHESGESAAQETAENNGTFHPGAGPNGQSNESSAHEAGESASREASEKS